MPDDPITTLAPAPRVNPSPAVALNPELPSKEIGDAEVDEAAKSLGMTHFSADKTHKLKKIGMFRAAQGVVHLGVGRLAACEEALSRMLETAVTIAEDCGEETERRVGALIAGKGIAEVMQKGISMEVEFQVDKLIGAPTTQKRRSFESDQPIIPIQAGQVNITVDTPRPKAES